VKTYPLFKTVEQVILCSQNVSTLHDSQEGWKRTPLLERRGEPADIRGRVVQRQVLYLGEINDSQRRPGVRPSRFSKMEGQQRRWRCFPRIAPLRSIDDHVVKIRLKDVELRRPRQWGACWLACKLYEQLGFGSVLWREIAAEPQGDALGFDR